jgi:hypothetical protein
LLIFAKVDERPRKRQSYARRPFTEPKKKRFYKVKMFLFLGGFVGSVFFAMSATSPAAPLGGGFRGGGFHGRFVARNAGPAFTMGRGIRRDFTFHQNRFFHRRDHRFSVQQFIWPVYWGPYFGSDYYPWDASNLDYGPDNEYGYGSGSAAPVQPEYSSRTTTPGPLVVVINQGNSRPTDNPNAGYSNSNYNSNYGSTAAEDKPRMAAQGSNEQAEMRTDPLKFVSPAAPQAAVQAPQAIPQPQAGGSGKLVLVSWLNDNGKDEIYVQNVETNEVQRITSEPNRKNFRIVEVHPNADPKEFEAIISNGSEQIPVRFRF